MQIVGFLMRWLISFPTVKKRKESGLSFEFAAKCSKLDGVREDRKKRSDCCENATTEKVEQFYKQPDIAITNPDKKNSYVKSMQPKKGNGTHFKRIL